ncbi:hypothetical protein [Levilactobacillus huananensis]|uniref:hypothetical protein n=1 Tax=Levilactobacillus huananensis TaxID=2486019 RepID=UPI000F770EC7|nr:hypothetical protein [Levilactobacillus huananensis]
MHLYFNKHFLSSRHFWAGLVVLIVFWPIHAIHDPLGLVLNLLLLAFALTEIGIALFQNSDNTN